MRKFVLAVLTPVFLTPAAIAADLPVKAVKAPAAVPLYNWTGLYIGGHGGGGSGRSAWVDDPAFGGANLGSHKIRGGLGGGQIGYNWQFGAWVFGIEAAGSAASIKGNHVDQFLSDVHTKADALGTVAGRIGYAWDRLLIYAKGGGGWAHFKYTDFDTTLPGSPLNGQASETRWGGMGGGGVEYAFAPGWSAFAEYNYMGFGSDRFAFCCGTGGNFTQDIKDHIHVVKGGINWRIWPR